MQVQIAVEAKDISTKSLLLARLVAMITDVLDAFEILEIECVVNLQLRGT